MVFLRRTWIVGCLILTACSTIPRADDDLAGLQPSTVEITHAPFHPQADYECGPAALATVLGAAGVERTPEALRAAVFLPGRQGSLQAELLAATRRSGLLPYVLDPTLTALLAEVAAGHPVLVLQDVRPLVSTRWHYAVVIGYDLPRRRIVLRSGTAFRHVMSLDDFDRSWEKSGRWAFVALPPAQLPAGAAQERLVAAAIAFEQVAPAAALATYAAALERWPDNLLARLALGNAAYWRHDLAAAEAAYRQAILDHPDAGDAWNNLAQTLHEAGRPEEARAAAEKAVDLGGPHEALYEATRAAIVGESSR